VRDALSKAGITTLNLDYKPTSSFGFTPFLPDGSAGMITCQKEKWQYTIPMVGAFGSEPCSDYQPIPYGLVEVQAPTAQAISFMLPTLYSDGKVYEYNSKPYQIKALPDRSVIAYYNNIASAGKVKEGAPTFILKIEQKADGLRYRGEMEMKEDFKVDSATIKIPSTLSAFKSTSSIGSSAVFCTYENEQKGKSRNGQLAGYSLIRYAQLQNEKKLDYQVIFATE
jgi:hypothetical protein